MTKESKFKNDKFYAGSFKGFDKTKGWFVGSFFEEGNPLKTDRIEIMYKKHKKGDACKPHYHTEKIELLIFVKGKAKYTVNDKVVELNGGDFLFVDTNNIISGEFLTDSTIFAIHSPSIPTDKFEIP